VIQVPFHGGRQFWCFDDVVVVANSPEIFVNKARIMRKCFSLRRSDWFPVVACSNEIREIGCSAVAKRLLSDDGNLLVGAALHDAGEFAVVEFATSGFDLVEHLGDLSLGETVGLDTTRAEKALDGVDSHLAGGGGVEQVPAGHDGLLGVGSGHLLTEELEEHLEVEGTGGLGDHGAQGTLVAGLAQVLGVQGDKIIGLQHAVVVLVDHAEDLLELFDLSLIEHLEGLVVGA